MLKKYLFSFLLFVLCANNVWWATFYFNGATNNDWNNLANWWTDASFTSQAESLPTSSDDVIMSANVESNDNCWPWMSCDPISVNTIIFDTDNSGIASQDPIITITVANGAIFNGASSNNGTIIGDVTFNDTSNNSGTVSGNATFNDTSYNNGAVSGNAIFNGTSTTQVNLYSNSVTFNDSSTCNAVMDNSVVDVIFNGSSTNYCTIFSSNTTFNGSSKNQTSIYGSNITFNDTSYNNAGGLISWVVTFNDNSYNMDNPDTVTIEGYATFNDNSSNNGIIDGDASVYYPSAYPIGGTVSAINNGSWMVTYYDFSGAPTMSMVYSDTANGSYTIGAVIDIDFSFSTTISSIGNIVVTLDTGDSCTFAVTSANTATCNYTVGAGDTSSDLAVSSVSGIIFRTSGLVSNAKTFTNFVPANNLATDKAIVIDTTGPVISSIASSPFFPSGSSITWTTSEASSSRVEYGLTDSYGTLTTLDNTLETSHTVNITGLSQVTSYHFRVISVDAIGNSTTSADDVFRTSGATPGSSGGNGVGNNPHEEKTEEKIIKEWEKEIKKEEKETNESNNSPEGSLVVIDETPASEDPKDLNKKFIVPAPSSSVTDNSKPSIPVSVLSLNITPQRNNSPWDVIKLQQFFNEYEWENLVLSGLYDSKTQESVRHFQLKYNHDILAPLGIRSPTGNVGIFTRAKINSIMLGDSGTFSVLPLNITPIRNNYPGDVTRLQQFFNDYEGESLELTGVYDWETRLAVNRFQMKYSGEILVPLGLTQPTGNVGIFTRAKIQSMMVN